MILLRYFAREVFGTMLAIAGVVLVISLGWRFSGYLAEAAKGLLTSDVLFLLIAYRLPGFLELILPISFFLAILLAYGRLYVDSEMVVLQSCGMSTQRLVMMTLGLSLVVAVLTAMLTIWLKPAGEAEVERLLQNQQKLTEFDTLAPGRFQSLRSGSRVTYTDELSDDGVLKGLFMNELSEPGYLEPKWSSTLKAERGTAEVDAEGNRFLVLKDGVRYSGEPGRGDYRIIEYEEFGQLIQRDDNAPGYNRRTAIPTRELLASPSSVNSSELQWRISVVLMVPVIAVMAIPLSRVNPRQGRFTRLVPGMICCFLYVICLSAARSAVEKGQLPVMPGIWWIHGVFAGLVVLLFNMHRWVRA